jgi:hypothetical protein
MKMQKRTRFNPAALPLTTYRRGHSYTYNTQEMIFYGKLTV